ncbi:MAG: alpha/beta fold hydrolase [Chitinophagales bacterium]
MKKSRFKFFLRITIWLFILLNVLTYIHAYKFTHFSLEDKKIERSKGIEQLTMMDKLALIPFGVDHPKPQNEVLPTKKYERVTFPSRGEKEIEGWLLPVENAKGTVILFHGYLGVKSLQLEEAYGFNEMGYNALMIDFLGHGGSEGKSTSIGYGEAVDVIYAYYFAEEELMEDNIVLFGASMGAAAILRALSISDIQPAAILVECPFGSMQQTIQNRFTVLNAPSFPTSQLLVLWGGLQNGFWAFKHNPADYAKAVRTPTLLMYGKKDSRVMLEETESIYQSLSGYKHLQIFENSGHQSYCRNEHELWMQSVEVFLEEVMTGEPFLSI